MKKKNISAINENRDGTTFCCLHSAPSVLEFLKESFSSSNNQLKVYFSKKFLSRPVCKGMEIFLPFNFINCGEISPTYEGKPLEIIFENEYFLVFNKNPNQFIHPLTYLEKDNSLAFFRVNRPELLGVNRQSLDRGLLYRLDYETSGVSILVKSDSLYFNLRENFKEIARKKIYLCWVMGRPKMSGSFKHFFSKSELKGRRVLVSNSSADGVLGELSFSELQYQADCDQTLLEVHLKTGLRHQIRAQLAHLGHPIVGDIFYGGKPAKRLYLHALTYELNALNQLWSFTSKASDFNGL